MRRLYGHPSVVSGRPQSSQPHHTEQGQEEVWEEGSSLPKPPAWLRELLWQHTIPA